MYNEKEDYKRDYDEEYRESDLRRDGWERVSDSWYSKEGSLCDAYVGGDGVVHRGM